jgi:hypothetical protein
MLAKDSLGSYEFKKHRTIEDITYSFKMTRIERWKQSL